MAISLDYIRQLCLEGESSRLDYKKEQYAFIGVSAPEKAELFKDILAMANAFRSQVAYILIGVEQQQDGIGKVIGIPKVQFIDDAKLQQFINGKTNRPVEFHSYSVPVDDKRIIQVIEIPVQKERPYYSQKQFGSVKRENVELRIGSSTRPATPDEIARMGKEVIIQQNQREIEISLIVPQNPIEEINFSALDIVLEGDPPAETKEYVRLYTMQHMCRPIYFYEKTPYVCDVFRTDLVQRQRTETPVPPGHDFSKLRGNAKKSQKCNAKGPFFLKNLLTSGVDNGIMVQLPAVCSQHCSCAAGRRDQGCPRG